jgi:hypothetical protein
VGTWSRLILADRDVGRIAPLCPSRDHTPRPQVHVANHDISTGDLDPLVNLEQSRTTHQALELSRPIVQGWVVACHVSIFARTHPRYNCDRNPLRMRSGSLMQRQRIRRGLGKPPHIRAFSAGDAMSHERVSYRLSSVSEPFGCSLRRTLMRSVIGAILGFILLSACSSDATQSSPSTVDGPHSTATAPAPTSPIVSATSTGDNRPSDASVVAAAINNDVSELFGRDWLVTATTGIGDYVPMNWPNYLRFEHVGGVYGRLIVRGCDNVTYPVTFGPGHELAVAESHYHMPCANPFDVGQAIGNVLEVPLRWSVAGGELTLTPTKSSSISLTLNTVAASSVASTRVVDPRIIDWLSRTRGRTISYTAVLSCMCAIGGTWDVTELDGVISHKKFIDKAEMGPDAKPLTLTEALMDSIAATGRVTVVSSSSTSIHGKVDPILSSIDDEFEYDAQPIVIR